jgi:hypothetical protein
MSGGGWAENLFRPLAVGAMMGCIALSLVNLIQLFFPNWNGTYMVVGCVLAAVEANYSYRLIQARDLRGADVVRFRAFEIALFFVLLRIGSMIGVGWAKVWADLRAWPREPWRILDLEVGYAFILTLLSWTASTGTTYDLERIGEPPVRDRYYVYPMDALTSRFFWGGAMLLWTAGITRIGISALLNLSRPSVPGLVLNVLLYFTLGLVMLGQVEHARLSQRWRKEGIDVPKDLGNHWVRYTLLFLGLTGLIAFLLPTGYTLPLLEVASIVIGAVLYVFTLIFQLAILLFFLVLTPLAKLFGVDTRGQPPGPLPPPQLSRATGTGLAPGWLEVVRSVIFWTVALAVVVYIVRSYLRDRPELPELVTTLRPFRAARSFLLAAWRRLGRLASAARHRLPIQVRLRRRHARADQPSAGEPFRFFRLGGLSRRQRTLYYYLSILRRATRQGYPRGPAQTPYEYDAQLGPHVPQAEEEMDRLTEAFVETRYSTHPIDQEQERHVRADWRKVRAALRSLRQRSDTSAGSETKPA